MKRKSVFISNSSSVNGIGNISTYCVTSFCHLVGVYDKRTETVTTDKSIQIPTSRTTYRLNLLISNDVI